jgi:hypothetical protein
MGCFVCITLSLVITGSQNVLVPQQAHSAHGGKHTADHERYDDQQGQG